MDVEESPGCTAADGRSRSVSGATATVTALVEVASDMAEIGANTNTKWPHKTRGLLKAAQMVVLIWLLFFLFFLKITPYYLRIILLLLSPNRR